MFIIMALLVLIPLRNAEGRTVTVNAERYKVVPLKVLRSELHPCQQDLL